MKHGSSLVAISFDPNSRPDLAAAGARKRSDNMLSQEPPSQALSEPHFANCARRPVRRRLIWRGSLELSRVTCRTHRGSPRRCLQPRSDRPKGRVSRIAPPRHNVCGFNRIGNGAKTLLLRNSSARESPKDSASAKLEARAVAAPVVARIQACVRMVAFVCQQLAAANISALTRAARLALNDYPLVRHDI